MQSGRETLGTIDSTLGKMRRDAETLDAQFQRAGAEFAKVRQAQLAIFTQLAKIRIRELESGDLVQSLDETDRRVREILEIRDAAQQALDAEVAAAEEALAERERERDEQQSVVDAAAEALDAAEAEAQSRLAADESYQAALADARDADTVADQAEAKAAAAETDRAEKGEPYEADPVFVYLWRRGYGTSAYRAWPLTRLLDRWVARSAGYEALRRNYALLTEIPPRLTAHAERMRANANESVEEARELERRAAEGAGVPARQQSLAAAEKRLAEIDAAIEEQEAAIDALAEKRAAFAAAEDEHSQRCAELLANAFQQADRETLLRRVGHTRSEEDDRLIEQLEDLEDDRQRLQDELVRYRRLHQAHRERMLGLEDVRRQFKRHRYDDIHSGFVNGALIAMLLNQFLVGSAGANDVWEAIRRQQRYRGSRANPGFGTGGLRGPFPGPWRIPGGGGGDWNFPRGGGFGGGGFGRGGGFGGGGFKTGGGF